MKKKETLIKIKKLFAKKGDQIKILTGNLKGKIGKIISINKKTLKANLEISDLIINDKKKIPSIHISNLQLWDNVAKVSSRIGYKFLENSSNQKRRYFIKSKNFLN